MWYLHTGPLTVGVNGCICRLKVCEVKRGKVNGQVWGRQAKVNTFNSRLKLLIPAHLCTINKVWGGWWKTAGTKFPLRLSVRTLRCLPWEGCSPPTPPHPTPPNASFSFRRCHLHWFSICFPLAADHQLYGQERVWGVLLSQGLQE